MSVPSAVETALRVDPSTSDPASTKQLTKEKASSAMGAKPPMESASNAFEALGYDKAVRRQVSTTETKKADTGEKGSSPNEEVWRGESHTSGHKSLKRVNEANDSYQSYQWKPTLMRRLAKTHHFSHYYRMVKVWPPLVNF